MIRKDLEIKLSIGYNEKERINAKMKSIMGIDIKRSKTGSYIIPKELFDSSKKVNDVIRYEIKFNNKNKTINLVEENTDLLDSKYSEYKKLAIITESPHKNEYSFNYEPIGPAQAKTGIMIEKYMDVLLSEFDISDGKLIIIISNPVQFQASLGTFYYGKIISSIRDNLWTALYDEKEFLSRLSTYKPNYILNASTYGRIHRINKAISSYKNNYNNVMLKQSNHPSDWESKRKINIKDV
ncbi:MAG: hypothetical protein KIB00_09570 [Paeniclostridium sordellii]|nr:hypothetical protein [Paeniclostridium sordellii]